MQTQGIKTLEYTAVSTKVVQQKHESVRGNTERHDGLKFTSFQRDGRRCYECLHLFACVKRNKMDSELLTCLLKFTECFPDYFSALSRTLLRCFGQPLSKQLYTRLQKRYRPGPCIFVLGIQIFWSLLHITVKMRAGFTSTSTMAK